MSDSLRLTYILPLRHDEADDVTELGAYVRGLAETVETIVADGSPPEVFALHREAFGSDVVHVRPDPQYHFGNGKVDGVMTGLHLASNDSVVVADEDVRWSEAALARAADLLERHDVVRPQNYFDPLPWHARWDTARSLLNRAFGADYPGTLAVRRSTVLAAGGYDGNAMFENLELIRTVVVAGGTVTNPLDLYVRRIPPTARQFWGQRVRQAYDDFAQPPRLVGELSLLPLALAAVAGRRWGALAAAAGASVAIAERGRRRAGGTAVYPASCSLYAPFWVAERAVCVWLAVGSKVRWGGIRYRGRVLPLAATSTRELRRRRAAVLGTPEPALAG